MKNEPKGGELFIVDNSVSGWTGLRYLGEWSGIAKAYDIATGYFEIGSLLALDGKWQPLEKIRILMGAEMTHRTRKALEKTEFLICQDIFLSESAQYADVVLPAFSFAEKEGTFTNTERRVQRVRKAVNPPGEARDDWRIVCDIANAVGMNRSPMVESIIALARRSFICIRKSGFLPCMFM